MPQARLRQKLESNPNATLSRLGKEILLSGLRLIINEEGHVLGDLGINSQIEEG